MCCPRARRPIAFLMLLLLGLIVLPHLDFCENDRTTADRLGRSFCFCGALPLGHTANEHATLPGDQCPGCSALHAMVSVCIAVVDLPPQNAGRVYVPASASGVQFHAAVFHPPRVA